MKLYAYELKLFKEDVNIEVKMFGVRENKTEYFSSTHELPVDAYQSRGGWYIDKNDVGKEAYIGMGISSIYVVFLTNNKMEDAKKILKNKLAKIIEEDRLKLSIKEKLFNNF